MANFSSGVKEYIMASATVTVGFPVNFKGGHDVSCYQCPMFSRATGICHITKEVSEYPQKYIGSHCPLDFSGEIKENEKEKENNENN